MRQDRELRPLKEDHRTGGNWALLASAPCHLKNGLENSAQPTFVEQP